ncbi:MULTISPECIES: dethiobiotin synthase [Tatumella]|uniref:ATP-dependent dethiobiotin synthetase BioD n=1 Tax=Tatumella punctata TaxID=399969 RepID=A0ABW1VND2_9GAMM|nr:MULTISPECIES: dethiobiotin synthase [unclassified Tatumella]MBS0854651.1 ATP-dependent dethiobiotin synthetase BioD [Tatumella sp. JGM16]MBS0875920.1 ATP-dependent dethiobiotin synthetase BioD [Tatumella sp. JGM82]MBS0890325.1 ATP-dependent dethiobiotin synthetase BioD [Tatumella sp. JGM94]MBS0900451.1 ATP-dependent dethiobiotin synthetase BioD [Tatumella sp. JGM100]MBS0911355.1 ATP-dependent dethiobiotin synthetase BioD [Tatumella sp. JGM91]
MNHRWFITGTDTEAGKTVATTALLQAAATQGWRAAGYKPVASGSEMTPQGLRNSDGLLLQQNSLPGLDYHEVNPLVFAEATSPHIVSAAQRQPISAQAMSAGLRHLETKADWIGVEGAGGWFTPLADDFLFSDWVVAEQLPVVLVVGMKLGCINHALLSAAAIRAAGLTLSGWIANCVQPPQERHQPYMETLIQRLPAPLLGEIPQLTSRQQLSCCGQYVDLPAAVSSR